VACPAIPQLLARSDEPWQCTLGVRIELASPDDQLQPNKPAAPTLDALSMR
jgi:hypothetical protein